ncbi:KR domain-containing protein [Amycolatopsis lurida]|nr:KR domain-containing protein [Amycolatopsis lurida]
MAFHTFDYDQMMSLNTAQVRECLHETVELFEKGVIDPLPVTEVPAEKVDKGFMTMGGPDHFGKVAVHIAGEPITVPASSLPETPIRRDATYLVTGGLGGLGRTVARLLADRGTRHLALVSRNGVRTQEAERTVVELTSRGVEVRVEKADVADRDQVAALLSRVRGRQPAIAGIIHAAADFDDVVLADADATRLVKATRPKADGAWSLHLETEPDSLDFFVLFSSVGAQLGSAALGAYSTANEFLDGLARCRAARGLPATSIGWGLIEEVGVAVSGKGEIGTFLRRNRHVGLSPARFAAELDTLLRTRPVETNVADMDWPRWGRSNPQLASLPQVRSIVPSGASDGGGAGSGGPRLHTMSPEERAALLPTLVAPLLQQSTGLTEGQLDDDQPVDVDSLTAVGLRVLVQKELRVSIPAVKLQRDLTMSGLIGLLIDEARPARRRDIRAGRRAHRPRIRVEWWADRLRPPQPASRSGAASSRRGVHRRKRRSLEPRGRLRPDRRTSTAASGRVRGVHRRPSRHAGARRRLRRSGGNGRPGDRRHRRGGDLPGWATRNRRRTDKCVGHQQGRVHRPVGARARAIMLALRRPDHGLVRSDAAGGGRADRAGSFLPADPEFEPEDLATWFFAPERRPMNSLGKATTPMLALHGDADEIIPVEQPAISSPRRRRPTSPRA